MISRVATLLAAATAVVAVPFANRSSELLGRADGDTIWCGAIQTSEPSGQYNQVSGTWTIPQLTPRAGQDINSHLVLPIWVGIDGYGCEGLLQSGSTSRLQPDGSTQTDVWIEFFPDGAVFQNWSVNVGEQISVQIVVTSATSGDVTITNDSTGQTTTQTYNAPANVQLCNKSVEWIMEWSEGGTPSFPDTTITAGGDNTPGNAVGATLSDVQQGGVKYCTGAVDGSGNVVIHSP